VTFRSNGKTWKQILRNAVVLGGITGVSNLIAVGGFSIAAVYAAFLAAVLVALVEIKHAYKILPVPERNNKNQTTFFFA